MKKYTFAVNGMQCALCESHINDMVRNLAKIKSVKSDRRQKRTIVTADELDVDKIVDGINKLGYDASLLSAEDNVKSTFFDHFRR